MLHFCRLLSILLLVFSSTTGERCQNPAVQSHTYTTQDATVVTSIAYISEFTFQCSNSVKDVVLYADINGQLLPVLRSSDGTKYQVSWTQELKKATKGDHTVHLYDEDAYAAIKKAQRSGDASSIQPLFSVTINHPGAYRGPWVNSEFMAASLAVIVSYFAYSAKSKLLA